MSEKSKAKLTMWGGVLALLFYYLFYAMFYIMETSLIEEEFWKSQSEITSDIVMIFSTLVIPLISILIALTAFSVGILDLPKAELRYKKQFRIGTACALSALVAFGMSFFTLLISFGEPLLTSKVFIFIILFAIPLGSYLFVKFEIK